MLFLCIATYISNLSGVLTQHSTVVLMHYYLGDAQLINFSVVVDTRHKLYSCLPESQFSQYNGHHYHQRYLACFSSMACFLIRKKSSDVVLCTLISRYSCNHNVGSGLFKGPYLSCQVHITLQCASFEIDTILQCYCSVHM